MLRKALKLGVQGFVSKSAEPAHITSAIKTLHEGRRWIDPDVSALAVVDDCPLTDREIDVLRATGHGYSVADIAAQLHLAEGTVRNCLSNAMQKTQTRTRHEAARYAREHDWLQASAVRAERPSMKAVPRAEAFGFPGSGAVGEVLASVRIRRRSPRPGRGRRSVPLRAGPR